MLKWCNILISVAWWWDIKITFTLPPPVHSCALLLCFITIAYNMWPQIVQICAFESICSCKISHFCLIVWLCMCVLCRADDRKCSAYLTGFHVPCCFWVHKWRCELLNDASMPIISQGDGSQRFSVGVHGELNWDGVMTRHSKGLSEIFFIRFSLGKTGQ